VTRIRALFDEIRIREPREGGAPMPLDEEGAVRIMTVHAAKGLEAPIVAVFDMNYQPRPFKESFLFSKQDGASFSLRKSQSQRDRHTTTLFDKIKANAVDQNEQEAQRILYVAMTRAREKLLLSASGTVKENGSVRLSGWLNLIVERLHLDAESMFDQVNSPAGPVPLLNIEGENSGIQLRRSWSVAPAKISKAASDDRRGKKPRKIPAGFPLTPERLLHPISVVAWIESEREFPGYTLTEDGEVSAEKRPKGSGIAMGRWVHRLLEVLPIEADKQDVVTASRREALQLFGCVPTEIEIRAVSKLLINYMHSSLAARVQSADKVVKEFPFLFELENQLFRGKIDLAFQESDGWILVDFKSDREGSGKTDNAKDAYRDQLLLYVLGWKILTGTLPAVAYLYYLSTDELVPVEMDAARIEAIKNRMKSSHNEMSHKSLH
jgi:ATP-dependent helicase/nuclease subunit A